MTDDFTTTEGVLACADDLLPKLIHSFNDAGGLCFGVLILTSPKIISILCATKQDAPTFFERAYRTAYQQHRAVGVFSFGSTWSVAVDHPRELGGRTDDFSDHPQAFEALICTLEHRTLGVRSWISTVVRVGGKGVGGSFKSHENIRRPDQGYLEFLRGVS